MPHRPDPAIPVLCLSRVTKIIAKVPIWCDFDELVGCVRADSMVAGSAGRGFLAANREQIVGNRLRLDVPQDED